MNLRMMVLAMPAALLPCFAAPALAACISPAPAGGGAIDSFNAAPAGLLSAHTNGGAGLINQVRDLVVSDGRTLGQIVSLVAQASPEQRAAIGTGLAQAAGACVRTEPTTAQAIQEAIVLANNDQLAMAFRATAGDVRTASVGAGAGGGLGGAGLQTSPSFTSNNGGTTGTNASTSSFANAGSSIGAGGGSSITPITRSTAARSVSPF